MTLTTPTSLPELKERSLDFYDRLRTNESKDVEKQKQCGFCLNDQGVLSSKYQESGSS